MSEECPSPVEPESNVNPGRIQKCARRLRVLLLRCGAMKKKRGGSDGRFWTPACQSSR